MKQNKTALVAMSGGVDSSVTAWLMVKNGYNCCGATMRLYRNDSINVCQLNTCCSQRDIDDASEVAFQLDMPYEVVDFTLDFKKDIIEKFITTYENGATPNPCVDCNYYMKFDKLLTYANKNGFDKIATGHYAQIEKDENTGRYLLKKAVDINKDQSYVLYMLTQNQLEKVCFPLGALTKPQVREIAQSLNFTNAKKHDSQDICFVPDGDYVKFMQGYTGKVYESGNFLDEENNIIGKHSGAVRYTIGQRKGLNLAMGKPVYVIEKNMQKNTVTVGSEESLYAKAFYAEEMNWISIENLTQPMRVKAKVRYRQVEQWATAHPISEGEILVVFDDAQRAIAKGQAVVLYNGDYVVGGGTISKVLPFKKEIEI